MFFYKYEINEKNELLQNTLKCGFIFKEITKYKSAIKSVSKESIILMSYNLNPVFKYQ